MKAIEYITFLFFLSFSGVNAQNDMLISQLADKLVVRKNFDKKGNLLNQQIFKAANLIKSKGQYELEVVTEFLDQYGKSKDKYSTTYRCNTSESSVVVMAFPFSNPKSKQTVINTTSKNFKELYDLDKLENVELEISFDSGLLNFFGSKSKIKIYNRRLQFTGNQKEIKSEINVKAYAIGIRIKQLDYSVIEKLNTNGFLTFQKFTENDGSYFTMTYKDIEK